jgi:hypothetical protein
MPELTCPSNAEIWMTLVAAWGVILGGSAAIIVWVRLNGRD